MKKEKILKYIRLTLNILFSVLLIISLYMNAFFLKNNNDIYNLDIIYKTEYEKVESNVEKVNVTTNSSCEWLSKVDLYYNKLVEYYVLTNNENMIEKIKKSQNNWEVYVSVQVDMYNASLMSEYGSGTVVPIKQSYFIYRLNRERALCLYEQCLNLSLNVEAP